MSQQINLLNPTLIKQKDFLNTNTIAITLGLLLVLMFGYYAYAQKQLSLRIIQRSQVAEELSAIQAQLKQSALLHAPRELDKALQDQITQLELKEAMQQQVLQTVSMSSATPDKGYAALMRAFAKQTLEGLWLTGFSIDSNTQQLNINGRTLEANLVPEYLSRLSHEPALQGKQFSGLNMSQSKTDAATNKVAIPDIANTESPYIEFKLQSIITESDALIPATKNVDNGGKP
ncbi:MAG: PilN domain-containing protein [Methylotenera sp.]|nr:PilN domain-containing protein [Methylotenera sp.]